MGTNAQSLVKHIATPENNDIEQPIFKHAPETSFLTDMLGCQTAYDFRRLPRYRNVLSSRSPCEDQPVRGLQSTDKPHGPEPPPFRAMRAVFWKNKALPTIPKNTICSPFTWWISQAQSGLCQQS